MKHRLHGYIAAALSAVICLAVLAGCSTSQTDPLNEYSDPEHGYKLSYNIDWTVNETGDGFAIKSPEDSGKIAEANILVTVTEAAEGETAVLAAEAFLRDTAAVYTTYEFKKQSAPEDKLTLGGKDACRAEFTVKSGEITYRSAVITCVNGSFTYTVLFTAFESSFDSTVSCLETVITNFAFTGITPSDESGAEHAGGTVKSANGDYLFECPEAWYVSRNDGLTAVKAESSGATVSVSAFSLSSEKSGYLLADYWPEYETSLKETLPGYTLTGEHKDEEQKLGGVVAMRKDYTSLINGVKYMHIQVLCIRYGYVYSVLFTSNEAEYEANSPAFDSVVSTFKFK